MNKFTSRKFLMAVVTGALVVLNDGLGLNLPTESIVTVAGVAISYIIGETVIDAKQKGSQALRLASTPINESLYTPVRASEMEEKQ